LKVMRGGNIGEPVLDRLDELTPDSWVVLELSSFQLESMARPRLHVGAILNVTPDHLDRHHTFARYVDMKARAVEAMTPEDTALLNFDDEVCRGMVSRTRGRLVPFSIRREDTAAIFTEDGWICIRSRLSGAPNRVLRVADVPLPGEHNLSNCLAAVGVGTAAEIPLERIAEAVRTFKGVEHRLELVGSFGGVRWYNDSKATNPDSTLKALSAFSEPMVLIAGGRNKGIDLEPLARAIAGRVAALVVIGETGDELARLVRKAGLNRTFAGGDLRQAVRLARHEAVAGGVVVLSPGFASFDMFRDFEDRGRQFKAAVRAEAGG
jgi:UDP-N-acetylmuramoylalanine--D-glutamate ligase